jgi:phosphoenolpyruvate synthase/pyruvate phosphate dikinase
MGSEIISLASRLDSLDSSDAQPAGERDELALRARDAVTTAPVPPDVEAAVRGAYAAMAAAPVAVRSSVTARWASPSSFNRWSTPAWPACCSPPIR